MAQHPPIASVAVIIVNYGTAILAIEAVKSVLMRNHGNRSIEIHLVDNASPGDDAEVLRTAHFDSGWSTKVTLHLSDTNHGFGRGNNLVLEQLMARDTPPDAVFLLNPDARLENEVIDLLAQRLDRDAGLGFVGAGISNPDGEPRVAAFRLPSILGEFAGAVGFGPVSRLLQRWLVPLPPETQEGDVGWVTGAAFMVRLGTLQRIGNFDPDFFLYYEEVELMWRGARAGWRARYVPEARVVHIEGAATDVQSRRKTRKRYPSYRYDSWRLYFTKTHGRLGALVAAVGILVGTIAHYIIALLRFKPPATTPYFFQDFWRYVVKPLLSSPKLSSAGR